jgi:hypothetical protein
MKKNLSIIYQFYLQKKLTFSYLDTLLTMTLLIVAHVFILEELIIKFVSPKNKQAIAELQKSNFSLILGFGIVLFFFMFYSKKKILEKKCKKTDLKTGIQKLIIYFGVLFIFLIILQNT